MPSPSPSWLTPKRRRTTGNLRTVANGRVSNETARTTSDSGSPKIERPTNLHRPISALPSVGNGVDDGNLFYAYARKNDELQSRYLLTFASASVANEFWLLLQIHFPSTTRPSPQLFSFQTDDFLQKVWQHSSFAHLKSKWMYISFADVSNGELGGAAQSVIPIQDGKGNMLGGSVRAVENVLPEVKEEAQEINDGVGRLEEYFGKMMEALERNTEKASELALRIRSPAESKRESIETPRERAESTRGGGYFDMDALSTHFSRLNELLANNSQHVESLAKKHDDNDHKLRETVDSLASKQQNNYVDMQQLLSYLEKMQTMMEQSMKERRDSARQSWEHPPSIDFSPLTDRLEKVQEAIEQNSTLVKRLLAQPSQIDLAPLSENLQRIHEAIETQSEHSKALVKYASGEGEDGEVGTSNNDRDLSPLNEHLEQIYNAIEEGNKHAKESQQSIDLEPLESHLASLRYHGEKNREHMQSLLNAQNATKEAVEANSGEIDFTPLTEYLEEIQNSATANTDALHRFLDAQKEENSRNVDFTPLTEPLQSVRQATEDSSEQIKRLVEAHETSAKKMSEAPSIDLAPLTERLNNIHRTLEKGSEQQTTSSTDTQSLLTTLRDTLTTLQTQLEHNAASTTDLQNIQQNDQKATKLSTTRMEKAITTTSTQIQSLIERNEKNEGKIEAQNAQMRELMSGQREMVEVMRQLGKSLVAQNKGACDHVVVPPPRKMGRKVVGFVYDAKDGGG